MSDKYFTVNIRVYLDKNEPTYIGEESLYYLLSDFSCPKNPDVEYFLLHNAIELFFHYCKANLCPVFKYQQDNGKEIVPCQYSG